MTTIFKKLNFKDQQAIVVLNRPTSFEPELAAMATEVPIVKDLKKIKELGDLT